MLAISFTEVTLNMFILIILLITEKGMWVYKMHIALSRRYIVERPLIIECICVEGPVGCAKIRVGSTRLVLGALPNANSRHKWFCILVEFRLILIFMYGDTIVPSKKIQLFPSKVPMTKLFSLH